jgi:hypothetical protein
MEKISQIINLTSTGETIESCDRTSVECSAFSTDKVGVIAYKNLNSSNKKPVGSSVKFENDNFLFKILYENADTDSTNDRIASFSFRSDTIKDSKS